MLRMRSGVATEDPPNFKTFIGSIALAYRFERKCKDSLLSGKYTKIPGALAWDIRNPAGLLVESLLIGSLLHATLGSRLRLMDIQCIFVLSTYWYGC
jgi:hypothetical protein